MNGKTSWLTTRSPLSIGNWSPAAKASGDGTQLAIFKKELILVRCLGSEHLWNYEQEVLNQRNNLIIISAVHRQFSQHVFHDDRLQIRYA